MTIQSNTQKVVKGVSSQTIVTILQGVVEIVGFSIMSRLLSEQDFGYFAAISAISAIFSTFADAGIGSAVIQHKDLNQDYINHAFTLNLLFGLFASMLLCFSSGPVSKYVADETMKLPLILISSTLLLGCLSSVDLSIMQRKLQFLRVGFIKLCSIIITTLVAIILATKGFGYYAILTKAILNSVLILFLAHLLSHTHYRLAFNRKVFKQIWGFSGWLMASGFFREIADQVDRLMMSSLFSVTTLGIYSRPKDFINSICGRLNTIFDSVLFPVLSSFQDDNERVIRSYQYALYFLNVFGLFSTFFFMFNSELLIRIFLGERWMNVNTLFVVLSVSSLLLINSRIGDIYLRSLAFTKQQFLLRILQAIFSIAFIIVASTWGIVAVAIGYMLAYAIVILVKMQFISKKINYGVFESLIVIIRSFKMSIIYLPIYLICLFFIPNTIAGNFVKLSVFMILTIFMFLRFPSTIGTLYKEIIYNKVIDYINLKIFRRKKIEIQ